MKQRERKTCTADFVTGVECDITEQPCVDLSCFEGSLPEFDYGVLKYTGGYGSPYDFLEVNLDLHPDLVVALFLLSKQGKKMASKDWCYKTPKFKITIEEQNENESSD
jgi:hypothetical protein